MRDTVSGASFTPAVSAMKMVVGARSSSRVGVENLPSTSLAAVPVCALAGLHLSVSVAGPDVASVDHLRHVEHAEPSVFGDPPEPGARGQAVSTRRCDRCVTGPEMSPTDRAGLHTENVQWSRLAAGFLTRSTRPWAPPQR